MVFYVQGIYIITLFFFCIGARQTHMSEVVRSDEHLEVKSLITFGGLKDSKS